MVRDDNFFTGVIEEKGYALWSRIIKNPDVSTGSLTCQFPHSLEPLIHSQACGKVNNLIAIFVFFFLDLDHSTMS